MKVAIVLLAVVVCSYAFVLKKEEHKTDKAVLGGALCDICKELVTGAEGAGEGAGEAWLKDEIKKLCHGLGGFLETICETILDGLVSEMGELINQGQPPAKVCKEVDLC